MVTARVFSLQDQLDFAQVSGDWNPLHVDAVAARRTIFGAPIVHGVHQMLWALEQHCADGQRRAARNIVELRVSFAKPLYLEEPVTFTADYDVQTQTDRLLVTSRAGVTAELHVRFDSAALRHCPTEITAATTLSYQPSRPVDLTIAQAAEATGELALRVTPACVARLFPTLWAELSQLTVAELLATTRLVGMVAPGQHSLFAGLDLRAATGAVELSTTTLRYRPGKTSVKYSILEYLMAGPTLQGAIKAFYRPRPVEVRAATSDDVMPQEFGDVRALIIGGSRGLGAAFARAICMGGGYATVSYHRGAAEANALVQAIVTQGGDASAVQYDVTANTAICNDGLLPFTHAIYCATPVLLSTRKNAAFEATQFLEMAQFFVVGLVQLVQELRRQAAAPLCVIAPSTVFLNSGQGGLAYGVAKSAMEEACRYLVREGGPSLQIFAPRLPKTATDQTASLVASATADPITIAVQCLRQSRAVSGLASIGCELAALESNG